MSPIYEDENTTREDLFELRRKNRCKVCGGMLNVFLSMKTHKAYLACNSDQTHEGIERQAQEPPLLNIPTRRKDMVEELGEEKATKLTKYEGVVSLTRAGAMEVLQTIWPEAPEVEVIKAAMVCHQYGLNPLMKHIFLIPFKRRQKGMVVGEDWVTVLGIKAKRLIAHRCGDYSYLDNTPRVMTEEEQKLIFGEVDPTNLCAITKLRDSKGNEAQGYGSWPKDEEPYGVEKGNTKANMAFIRSESNALDRLFAGEMPPVVEVAPEEYIEGEYSVTKPEGGEKIGGAEKKETVVTEPAEAISSPKDTKPQKIGVSAAKPKRDPQTIKNFGDLYTACIEDFNIDRQAVWKELGVGSQIEIAETPAECYQRIAAVRG